MILSHTAAIVIDAQGIHFEATGAREADAVTQKQLKAYKANPLVPVAMFIWCWLKVVTWVLIIVGILYVVALVAGFFNPGGALYSLSQELIRFLPFANPIRWIHNLFGNRTLAVPAEVVPVATNLES